MNIRIKRIISTILMAMIVMTLIGCSGKITPKTMMSKVGKNLTKVTSFSNHVDMDIKMEDVVRYTKVTMDMEMENTMDPKAGHAKGTAELVMGGVNLSSELEIYQVTEGKEQITYSGMDGEWIMEKAEPQQGKLALGNNLLSEMGDSIDQFQLAKSTIELNGKECYEMYGDVSGKELMGVLGSQMLHGFGLVEIPADDLVADLKIPIIFDVYKEKMLPARMIVDMTEVLNQLFDQLGERTEVTHYEIKLQFQSYDEVGKIQVPEEIKNKAKGDE